jgi:hypothetical protein
VFHLRRLLEGERFGCGVHLLRQAVDDFAVPAGEEQAGETHVLVVLVLRHQADAGRRTAVDLVQQAGPRAVGEHAVLAGAQQEGALHQLYRLAHGPHAGQRPEIACVAPDGAAVEGDAREGVLRELDVGIGLVVPEQDVVLRPQALDQVVFEDERLGLGAHHRGVDAHHLRHHHADARTRRGALEVR